MFRETPSKRISSEQIGFIQESLLSTPATYKPFLKWAGGKSQLLNQLLKYVPLNFDNYIEPFLGGGALFFALHPPKAILSDLNPELVNCYIIVKNKVNDLIDLLKTYKSTEKNYYKIRSLDTEKLSDLERAARFIYLNKTCYNGLYRVNKSGGFNVPYGKNPNALICDADRLKQASEALQNATIIYSDYKSVLRRYAGKEDFIFLDPPYYPVGGYGDFQRYTKDFFYEEDHIELRDEFNRIVKTGCKVVLTNSDTSFVKSLYLGHHIETVEAKRLISSNANTRSSYDAIITGKKPFDAKDELLKNFPGTRYMGSKYKILPFLWDSIKDLKFDTALDAFSGSGCVSYMLKEKGIEVYSNDFLSLSSTFTKALIENSKEKLDEKDKALLLKLNKKAGKFVSKTFKNIFFDDIDNEFLDNTRANIDLLSSDSKKSIALSALARACMKKRARGIFTYVGLRYDDGRRDMQLTLKEHFLENFDSFNNAVFNNGKSNKSYNKDVFALDVSADLVYLDPPYLTSKSDNDYSRRYHFVEGLIKNWSGLEIDESTKTKKFKKYPSPFDSKKTVNQALDRLFDKFKDSILVVSYSSNSIPSKDEMIALLKKYKQHVELKEVDYRYSFGNQNHKIGSNANKVKEYLFIAK